DDDLVDGPVTAQRIQGAGVVVEREAVRDEAVGPGPSAAQRRDRGRERVDLGEGPLDGDLAPEHVVRADPYEVFRLGHAVEHYGPAAAGQRHALLGHDGRPGGVDHDVEPAARGRLQLGRVAGQV